MFKLFSNDGLPNNPFIFFVSALVGVVIIGEIIYCGFKFDTGELFHRKPQQTNVSVKNYNTDRREVTLNFECTPERIIAYHQNNIEILDKFGESDRIIASVGRFIIPHDVKQPEIDSLINKIPYYGQNGIDKETARYLNPDFIMGWPSSFGKRGVWSLGDTDYWLKRNVNCYMSLQQKDGKLYETIDGEYQYILDIGKIFKKDAEAMQIVSDIKGDVNKILSDNQHRKQQKVLILDFYGTDPADCRRQAPTFAFTASRGQTGLPGKRRCIPCSSHPGPATLPWRKSRPSCPGWWGREWRNPDRHSWPAP